MDDVLLERVYRLQVDTMLFTGLRVVFNVERTGSLDPNRARVSIYNLSEDTRARLSSMKRALVTLEAGYPMNMAVLFSGDTRRGPSGISHVKVGPDWITTLECGDGETAMRTARFVGSFGRGTPISEVAKELAKALGVGVGNLDAALQAGGFRQGLQSFSSGYAFRGRAGEELGRMLGALGLEMSIQDGKLQVLKPNETLAGKAVLLTKETGMIGSPSFNTPEGEQRLDEPATLKVASLLQPSLRPGVEVRVEAKSVRGSFKVKASTHTGDSRSGPWTTTCTCIPI